MEIRFLGACGEVGRSAFLINDEVLLDYGIAPSDPPRYPIDGIRPKSVIISHGHLDHTGILPNLMDLNPEIFMTAVTRELAYLLGKDTLKIGERSGSQPFESADLQRMYTRAMLVDYRDEFDLADGYRATLFDAGHIPGSSLIHLSEAGAKGLSLLYTGDMKDTATRLLSGSDNHYPSADILLVESTYFGEKHPDRRELEKAFIESVRETLDLGGVAIIPCFAIGRTQEILTLLYQHGIDPVLDGMGIEVTRHFLAFPAFLRDVKTLEKAFGAATLIRRGRGRKKAIEGPSVIVTTAGMLNGGPAFYYLKKLHEDPSNKILLTGYQVEGTNGRTLLEHGYLDIDGRIFRPKMALEQYDFSAHLDDTGLKHLVRSMCDRGVEIVFPIHGEGTEDFARWIHEDIGCDAIAPTLGESIVVDLRP
ncbi:MAG: MBL fold metallo-hydrolase [Candidatus Syntropharchaeales archaeon]|nr:MBL fold metallo-hydrolase [Candidatus Syntrophoarchaeum sp.]